MAKLKETYVKDIAPALYKKFGYKASCRFLSWIR